MTLWNKFSNAMKKALAFDNNFGVASRPVQGLGICRTLVTERMAKNQ
jgi:hypothetical protein